MGGHGGRLSTLGFGRIKVAAKQRTAVHQDAKKYLMTSFLRTLCCQTHEGVVVLLCKLCAFQSATTTALSGDIDTHTYLPLYFKHMHIKVFSCYMQ